jgi:hypothetical protein
MITARYIASLQEVRLYKDDGRYWPLKFENQPEAERFVAFVESGCLKGRGFPIESFPTVVLDEVRP